MLDVLFEMDLIDCKGLVGVLIIILKQEQNFNGFILNNFSGKRKVSKKDNHMM